MHSKNTHTRISLQEAKLPPSFIREAHVMLDAKLDDLKTEIAGYCDSPIEVAFASAFMLLCEFNYGEAALHEPGFNGNVDPMLFEFVLKCQPQIGPYRVDFLASWSYPQYTKKIVIECDGHEFHERTKDQAKRDRERDRSLQRSGYLVMRFTGSEIYTDAFQCATEVLEALLIIGQEASSQL